MVDRFVNGQINVQVIVRMIALRRVSLLDRMRVSLAMIVMRVGNLKVKMPRFADAGLQAPHPAQQQQSSH